ALGDLGLVALGIDPRQDLAFGDAVVVVDQHLQHLAGDLAADGHGRGRAEGTGGGNRHADVAALDRGRAPGAFGVAAARAPPVPGGAAEGGRGGGGGGGGGGAGTAGIRTRGSAHVRRNGKPVLINARPGRRLTAACEKRSALGLFRLAL